MGDSDLDVKLEHFNFKNLDIGTESYLEWDHGYWKWIATAKLFMEITLAQK